MFAGTALGRFFKMLAEFHLAVDALTLELLLQGTEGLIDVVLADDDLHVSYDPVRRGAPGQPQLQADPAVGHLRECHLAERRTGMIFEDVGKIEQILVTEGGH